MSFPFHDPQWCGVADFLDAHYAPGDRILANDIFWWRYDEIFRYTNLHLDPTADYDWVVVHKGELRHFPLDFLERLPADYAPVMANDVFVVWSSRTNVPSIPDSPHVTCFPAFVAERAKQAFEPQPVHHQVRSIDRKIEKFEKLSKPDLTATMDAFWERGGYECSLPGDRAYTGELDRWLGVFWQGLEHGDVIDLACGRGRVGDSVAGYQSMLEIDISPVAVALARQAGAQDQRRRAEVMDAESLDLPDHSFDVACFIEAVEHVSDSAAVFREVARVLRPGGAFIMSGANPDSLHLRLTRALGYPTFKTGRQHFIELCWKDMKALLESTGFIVERVEGIFLFPYWGVPGIDQIVRHVTDGDPDFVEALRVLGERAGPEFAYCYMVLARKA